MLQVKLNGFALPDSSFLSSKMWTAQLPGREVLGSGGPPPGPLAPVLGLQWEVGLERPGPVVRNQLQAAGGWRAPGLSCGQAQRLAPLPATLVLPAHSLAIPRGKSRLRAFLEL